VPIVLAGLLLALLVMLLFGGTELDRGLLMLLHVPGDPTLESAADILAQAASPPALAAMGAAGAGFLLVRRRWRDAVLLVAVTAGVLLLVELLTSLTASLRPLPSERALASQNSPFPHPAAAGAAATWLGLALLLARSRPWRSLWVSLAVISTLAVGTLQLVTGAAWPSDVIGGWALGLFWALLLLWLAGEDLGEGTPRAVRHSPREGEHHGQHPHGHGPTDGRQGPD